MAEIVLNTDVPQPTLQEQSAAQDAAAAEKAKATPAAVAEGRPDWLPENFKSVADFVKSSTDGRAEITRLQQELATLKKGADNSPAEPGETPPAETAPAKTAEELAASTPAEQQQAAQAAVAKAGVDVSPFQKEFAETGDVSADSRTKLAEALKGQFGEASKALVDQFIQGQKATRENLRNAGLNEAGGADQYAAMTAWAKDNMSPGEITAYNKAVDSGDVNAATLAIRGLRQTFEAKNGRAPTLNKGNNTAPGPGADAPFASAFEQTQAINDPRYAMDDAYRASVVRRMIASRL